MNKQDKAFAALRTVRRILEAVDATDYDIQDALYQYSSYSNRQDETLDPAFEALRSLTETLARECLTLKALES